MREAFQFQFVSPRLDTDEDIEMEMPSSGTVVQMPIGAPAVSSYPESETNSAPSASVTDTKQIVLYHNRRRRRTSEESTESSNQDNVNPSSGGWRPVRLQGYSEDPMKDEVIRGQTETIKLLQSQLQDRQNGSDDSTITAQHLDEAEKALHKERAKAAEQEKMIWKLKNELENYKRLTRPMYSQQVEPTREIDTPRQRPFRAPSPMPNEVSMVMDHQQKETVPRDQHNNFQGPDENTLGAEAQHQPKIASVPLPLSFKKTRVHRKAKDIPKRPPPVDPTNPPLWTDTEASASSRPSPRTSPATSLEAKVDLILNTLNIPNGGFLSPKQQRGHRLRSSEFMSPRRRTPKAEGRNERLAWVRNQLHELLGIRQDRDILNYRDALFAPDAGLEARMARFEKDVTAPGPTTLKPMQVNWDVVRGRWNESLLELFLSHCRENGYGDGQMTEEDEDEIGDIFLKRLERIQGIINEYRPKPSETIAQADKRYSDKHLLKLSVARRNRRRAELFNTRCDINMDHLPDDLGLAEHSDEETRRWIDRYNINEAFGIEGASSDETDPYESDTYHVHVLKWRSKDLSKKMRTTDAARRTTNEYGNSRPGNRPRTRKRRAGDELKGSSRKVPAGLPINCYDESWYNALSPKKMHDLRATQALKLLASWESD